MQNPIQKFRQYSIVFEKPVILSENLKTELQLTWILLKFCILFLLTDVYKRVFGVLFCLDLELFAKTKKELVSTHSQKQSVSITQDLNKIKNTLLWTFVNRKRAKFQQKILHSMVVAARQSFQFFRQITWFLKNNKALSKFKK